MAFTSRRLFAWIAFLVALAALLTPILLVQQEVMKYTGGRFTLPRDEAFVTVEVGKTLAFRGIWGLSQHFFQPAASSLLYPLILTPLFFIAGAYLIIPLIINTIAAILLIIITQRELIRRGAAPAIQLAVLLSLILLPPLPFLVISGTEYTLFLLLVALFATSLLRSDVRLPQTIYLYGFLLVSCRYEGLIFIVAASAFLLYRKKAASAIILLLAGALPVLLFGFLSLSKGGRFIPSAMLQPSTLGIYIAVIASCLIILCGMIIPVHQRNKGQWVAISLLGILGIGRTSIVLEKTTRTTIDTWQQQVETARFVHRYYYWYNLSLDQLGAISWFSEGRKIDLTGVANPAQAKRKYECAWSDISVDSLARRLNVSVAILTKKDTQLDRQWNKIASWNMPGDIISFYARDTAAASLLKKNIEEYERRLPGGVQVRYY
jgi:hypothetical protein